MTAFISLIVGVASAIIAVVCLQSLPTRYRWSRSLGLTEGEHTGQPIYQVWLGRRGRKLWPAQRNPMDVTIKARVSVSGLGRRQGTARIVPIPVDRDWRPALGVGILTVLFPQYCEPRDLRGFPQDVKDKRAAGTLRLEDLLGVGDAVLRMYAFAYRPYVGTRLMMRAEYRHPAITPGLYRHGEVEKSKDGLPPRIAEVLPPAWVTPEHTADVPRSAEIRS